MIDWKKLYLFIFCFVMTPSVLADSAAAWKAYQEGRNPLLEVGLLVVGVVVFFGLLAFINKAMESRKTKRTKNNRKKT